MLNALSEQLKILALNANDPFTGTIRKLAGPRSAPRYEANIRKMILSLPAMIKQIKRWTDVSEQPWQVRRLQSFALAYLYNPTDFMPDNTNGLLGYLDDAYLVGRVYERTMEDVSVAGLGIHEEDTLLRENIGDWLKLTQEIFPDETDKIDMMLDQYVHGKAQRTSRTGKLLGKPNGSAVRY